MADQLPEPLKLYADPTLKEDMRYSALLFPFWGDLSKGSMPYVSAALTKYGYDKSSFVLVDKPEDAEYIFVPYDYWLIQERHPEALQAMIALANRLKKPLLIDAVGDKMGIVSIPHSRVLRIHQYRFEMPPYEVTMPVPTEDLLEAYYDSQLSLREKSEGKPTVGFVGWAHFTPQQWVRSYLRQLPIRLHAIIDRRQAAKIKGVFWRIRANKIFLRSSAVDCKFLIRPSFSGNTKVLTGEQDKNRREFIDNILNTDYALVVRGDANMATRFYEVLSLGRIPVVIDTEWCLPLMDRIDYRECCVMIDFRDLRRAPEILAEFHKNISSEQYQNMQKRAREVYERYVRMDSFSKFLPELLRPVPIYE